MLEVENRVVASAEAVLPEADTEAQGRVQQTDAIYSDVLHCVAIARLSARRMVVSNGGEFDADAWMPTPDEIRATNGPRAERVARYISMANHVEAYKGRISETNLLEKQVEPFSLSLQFLGYSYDENNRVHIKDTVADVVGGGFAELSPGFGKTAIEAYAALALGPGKKLVLVPSRRILYQTVGKIGSQFTEAELPEEDDEQTEHFDPGSEVLQGFARFAPDLRVTKYYAKEKNQSGDVVVMTYSSFRVAMERGLINRDDYSAVLPDEAHRLMGTVTWQRLMEFTQGEMPIFGVTASGEYSEERRLVDFLRTQICDIEMRDQIDLGFSPAMQLIRVATNAKVKVRRRKGEYSAEELVGLAHDKERNNQIVDWVEAFVSEGRHVFVPSIAGDQCWHAHHLAELASKRSVLASGLETETRPIRVAVLDSSMSEREQDLVHAAWDAGEIDALFTVGMLGEGWSSGLLSAVVDGSPTTSWVVMEQRVGRLTREGEDFDVKAYVLLMDDILGHKPQVTPWHVLRETMIDPKKVIGKVDGLQGSGSPTKGSFNTDALPAHMAAALGERFTLIDELVLSKRAEDYRPPEAGWVPLADHYGLWKGLDLGGVRNLLQRHGHDSMLAQGRRGPMVHVHEDAIGFLRTYEVPDVAGADYGTVTEIGSRIGLSYGSVDNLASSLDPPAVPVDLRSRRSHVIRPHYSKDDEARMRRRLKELRTFLPGDELVRHIGTEYGLELTSTLLRMRQYDPPIAFTSKITSNSKTAAVLDAANAARLRAKLESEIITQANGRRTLDMLAELTGHGRTKVITTIADLGLTDTMKKGFFTDQATSRVKPAKFLEPPDVARVIAELGYTPEGAARTLHCSAGALGILLSQNELPPGMVHQNTRKKITTISAEGVDRLRSILAALPPAVSGWRSAQSIARQTRGVSADVFHVAAEIARGRNRPLDGREYAIARMPDLDYWDAFFMPLLVTHMLPHVHVRVAERAAAARE